jgi:hypothetical protein
MKTVPNLSHLSRPPESVQVCTYASTRQSLEEGHVPHQAQANHVTCAAEDLRQPQMGCHPVSQDQPGPQNRTVSFLSNRQHLTSNLTAYVIWLLYSRLKLGRLSI